ncbi:MAG: PHP domain-containing protein, partial [Burkholderiales bacterium]|nr:PHP domain-containing protein [Burkholderiales bacterium]
MPEPRFVHLRLHSEYTIVDGVVRIDEAVARARADGMPALALTDLGNLFGMVKFYQAARSAGIKPVVGCDVWLSNDDDRDKPTRALLLVQNRDGYLRLCRWLTRGYRENQHRGRAELRRDWFRDEGTDGLIALSGGHQGDIAQALLAGNEARAEALTRDWMSSFPDRFYIELQRAGHPDAQTCEAGLLRIASRLRVPPVATHPVQFLTEDQFTAHEARVCIAEGHVLSDQRRPKRFTPQQYFRTQDEMVELFADLPQALQNAVEIARRCNLVVELGKSRLPLFPTPEGVGLDDYLGQQAFAGLEQRLETLYPDAGVRETERPRYTERLEFEIRTIIQMGFPGYFLIV